MRNEKFKLPYRTYIWQGKAGKDLNGDGDIKNVAANPTAIPPTPEYKEEGWCFAFGEEEWLAGIKFSDALKQTKRHLKNRRRNGDANYKADCQ